MITAWRICQATFSETAFSGYGAFKSGGRWNSPGLYAVYTSQSRALAMMELLVHTNAPDELTLVEYVMIPVSFVEAQVENVGKLPKAWSAYPAPEATALIGDHWLKSRSSLALKVPSIPVPGDFNYVLNPAHPDFKNLAFGKPERVRFDGRLR